MLHTWQRGYVTFHNLAIWADPCRNRLPNSIGYWDCLYMALQLLLLSKWGLWQWDRQPLVASPWRGASKHAHPSYRFCSVMIITKKLIGFFLSNIDQHNNIYILGNIFLLCIAINFDAAIIWEQSCLFCGAVLRNTLQGSAVFIATASWISTSKYFLMYFTCWFFLAVVGRSLYTEYSHCKDCERRFIGNYKIPYKR